MTENYRQYQKLMIQLHKAMMFGTEQEADEIRDQMEPVWKKLTEQEVQDGNLLSEDLYLIEIPDLKDIKDKKIKILKLKEIVKGHEDSFDLYHRATMALHNLFPHPKPLTYRDMSQMCAMAAKEIKKNRKVINECLLMLSGALIEKVKETKE